MRAYCILDENKKETIHQLMLRYLTNQSTLPSFMTKKNKKKK
jgi:hypothetical protein